MMFKVLPEMVPYDTMVRVNGIDHDVCLDSVSRYGEVSVDDGTTNLYSVEDVKPYLRPMSSMTEEEYQEFGYDVLRYTPRELDWLNEHHFDYRGLIEKGLAIEAPEGMYKTE